MSMIKDIVTDTDSSDAAFFLNVGGTLYFQATDGFTGKELFRSDGTAEGTYLVDDIIPGKQHSFPKPIAALDDHRFLMLVQDGPSGLWVSDGTAEGTQNISNVMPDPSSPIGVDGGRIFFNLTTAATGQELWTSDGTAEGTHLVKDIFPGTNRSSISGPFTAAGGVAYFAADDGVHGRELWRSDGTEAGTYLVKDILPGKSDSSLFGLATLGNSIYFTATDGVNGIDLWKSDGTATGTVRAVPMNLVNYSQLYTVGNSLYLVNNSTLIKTDSTPAGTSSFLFPTTSPAVNDLHGIWELNGDAIIVIGNTVWRSDNSTAAGTSYVAKSQFFISEVAASPSAVYYIAQDYGGGNAKLWRTDGTTAGTFIVDTPGIPDAGYLQARPMVAIGENVYFAARALDLGIELFKVTPSATASTLVKDINSTIPFGSEPKIFRTVANYTYFLTRADSNYSTYQVWRTDGTADGTVFLFDSQFSGFVSSLNASAFGNSVVMEIGQRIWITTPQPATAHLLFQDAAGNPVSSPVIYHNKIYFTAQGPAPVYASQLRVSNGTTNSLIQLPASIKTLDRQGNLFVAGDYIYFAAQDSADNYQLWRTDGTLAGTVLLSNNPPAGGSWPDPMFALNGELYYLATDPNGKRRLWQSNGTPAGTVPFAPSLTISYDQKGFTPFGFMDGFVYFPASEDGSTTGPELWRSDGTPAGTNIVKDINPGNTGSDIREFETVGSRLFFTDLGQLYVTDGTDAGTIPLAPELIQNTSPEVGGAYGGPQQLTAVGSFLYFVAGDNIRGIELCRSDGTASGTVMVEDIDPGSPGGLYHEGIYLKGVTTLAPLGDQVIFGATDGVHGFEPWKASYDGEPIADAGAGYQVTEGESVILTRAASRPGSRPIVSYEWDLDYRSANDGFQVDATGMTASIGNLDGPASYTVALRVTDDAGVSSIDIGKINVINVPPTLAISGGPTVAEGSLYTLNLAVLADPGTDTIKSWKINWGDGSSQTFNGNPSAVTHVFANGPADYVISASATDEDGTYNTGGPTVNVTNVPPVNADIGPDRSVNEGTKVSMSATFIDPGVDPWVYTWHVTSDNGQTIADGTGKTFDFTSSDNGIYIVEYTVRDDGGGSASDSAVITVNNLPPTVELGNPRTSNEGAPFNLTAVEADPGAADILTRHWTVQYPDGSIVDGGMLATLSLSPPDNGIYTVFITLSDDDGGTASDSVVVTVNNVAPIVHLDMPAAAFTGATLDLDLTVTDPGQDTISKLAVNWGDGKTDTLTAAGIAQHSYATSGSYTISVTPTDEDGTYPAVTRAILITPRPTLSGTTLKINGTALADTVFVTANGSALDVTINGLAASFNLSDIAQISGILGSGDDAVTYNGPVPTGTIDLGVGNDAFTLESGDTSIPITVLGNLGSDTLRLNQGAARPVSFDGGSGSDTVYLSGSAADDVIALTPASATITGPATVNAATFTLSAVELRHVDAGAGNDSITLTEQGLAGLSETISGGDGDDTFNIGDPAASNIWTNSMSLSGDAGNDALIFNDQGSGKTFVYTLTATRFTRSTNSTLAGFETITLNAGALPDRIDVTPSTTTAFIIHAGNPGLTAPADRLGIPSSTVGATLNLTAIDSGSYTFADGRQPMNFTGVEQLSPPDSTRPKVSSAAFHPGARPSIEFHFSENVMGSVDLADLQVTNLTTGQILPSSAFRLSVSGGLVTNTSASWSLLDTLADGNYRARIPAASVVDPSDNRMLADFTFDFFVLAGDATSDRVVNFADLVAVAQNYNSPNKSWADGDFTGDGVVDFQDLVIIAQRYNSSLPAPPSGALPVAATPEFGFAPVQTKASASRFVPLKTKDSSVVKRLWKPTIKPPAARPRMLASASIEHVILLIEQFASVVKRPIVSAFGSKRMVAVKSIEDLSNGDWDLKP